MVALCQKHKLQHPHHVQVSPQGQCLQKTDKKIALQSQKVVQKGILTLLQTKSTKFLIPGHHMLCTVIDSNFSEKILVNSKKNY